jgi:amiloride-sensitive sodium channel
MPNEILTPFHKPEFFKVKSMKEIYMKVIKFTTSKDLRKFDPDKRGCYFEGERKLKFFKSYTKKQCEFECLANATLKACGCVKFSMPRNKITPICDLDKVPCYLRVINKSHKSCNCLQSCTYMEYDIGYRITRRPDFLSTSVSNYNISKE